MKIYNEKIYGIVRFLKAPERFGAFLGGFYNAILFPYLITVFFFSRPDENNMALCFVRFSFEERLMRTVILRPIFSRGQESMAMIFEADNTLEYAIRRIKGVKWSEQDQSWYLPLNREYYTKLKEAVSGHAELDNSQVRVYLEQRKTLLATAGKPPVVKIPQASRLINKPLSNENLEAYHLFIEQLKLKAYSESTIKTYRNEFMALLGILKKKAVKELTTEELRRYIVYCLENLKLTESTIHSRINALKFYFEQVLGKDKMFFDLPRPKKPIQLPKVIGESELGRLFNAIENKKHKAILFTAYSAGLRVSEVVNLQLKHIDASRMQIFISSAKGKKDRVVNLSPILLDLLRAYIKWCVPRPVKYLFEGAMAGTHLSAKSAGDVFKVAKERAKITKDVTFHSLRHSFATHLLEKGVDIRYIKDILGHFSIKTTERYLHVRKEHMVNIPSPLDDLFGRQQINW